MQRGNAINRHLDFYLGIPALNLLASFHRHRVCPEDPRRIGLLLNPSLGDTLLASAATQELRRIYPAAKLILFTANTNASAARLLPEIDIIKELPFSRPLQSIRIIRRCKLDMMLDFTAWQRITALYTLTSGARYTVGFARNDQHRHRGYDSVVPHRGDCHELENLRRFTRSLGSKIAAAPRLSVPQGPLPRALLRGMSVVVFHAWASGAHGWLREWQDDSWAALARRLMTPGRVFLLTGSPADEARCNALRDKLVAQGTPAEILVGRDGLGEIARVLTRAEMLVSVNTGIMHLGAILGTPTVCLNGPTAVHRWGPVGPQVANVSPSDGSGGFLDLGFEYRGRATNVMTNIPVDGVMLEIYRLWGIPDHAETAEGSESKWFTAGSRTPMTSQLQQHALRMQPDEQCAESL